jgi:hypothetical protein
VAIGVYHIQRTLRIAKPNRRYKLANLVQILQQQSLVRGEQRPNVPFCTIYHTLLYCLHFKCVNLVILLDKTIQFSNLMYLKKPPDVSIKVALEFKSLADMVFFYCIEKIK